MIQYCFPIGKTDNGGLHQRQAVSHIVKQVIELVADIKDRQADISQQNDKGQRLVLQYQHQKDRQTDNKDQRRNTYQQEIEDIRLPVDRHPRRHNVKQQGYRHNDQVQDQEYTQVSPYLPDHIFGIT